MELTDIKKGLFGFNKNSVFEYISELNRICSEKVEEERQAKADSLKNLSQKNKELNNKLICTENENNTLKKQILEQEELIAELREQIDSNSAKTLEAEVADILTEARQFAQKLREKAVKENEAFRLENQKNNEAEKQRIAAYSKDISEIKATINAVLAEAKSGLETAEKKITVLERKKDE